MDNSDTKEIPGLPDWDLVPTTQIINPRIRIAIKEVKEEDSSSVKSGKSILFDEQHKSGVKQEPIESKPEQLTENENCPSCGVKLTSSDDYCPECGLALTDAEPENVDSEENETAHHVNCVSCGEEIQVDEGEIMEKSFICPACGIHNTFNL